MNPKVAIAVALGTIFAGLGTATLIGTGKLAAYPYLAIPFYGVAAVLFFVAYAVRTPSSPTAYKPCVIPLRYDSAPQNLKFDKGHWFKRDGAIASANELHAEVNQYGHKGLVILNEGEAAHEIVARCSKKIGKYSVTLDGKLSRLTRDDGYGFFPVFLHSSDGSGLLGGLFEEMRSHHVTSVPIVLFYRNNRGVNYKTNCRIYRDVRASGGLTIGDVRHGRDFVRFLRRE